MAEIKVYGAPWCPDCRRTKKFLGEHRIAYDWVDIEASDADRRHVEELQNGGRKIPTIVFPDGSHLLEPSNEALARKLGLALEAAAVSMISRSSEGGRRGSRRPSTPHARASRRS